MEPRFHRRPEHMVLYFDGLIANLRANVDEQIAMHSQQLIVDIRSVLAARGVPFAISPYGEALRVLQELPQMLSSGDKVWALEMLDVARDGFKLESPTEAEQGKVRTTRSRRRSQGNEN